MGQCRFCHDGVAFKESRAAVNGTQPAGSQLPAQDVQPAEGSCGSCLHLRHVAGFVDGEQVRPRGRVEGKGIRSGQQFHAPGRPGNLPVGLGGGGVEHDRHPAAVRVVRTEAEACADGDRRTLQRLGVHPRQGVESAGIDELVGGRVEAAPAEAARVGAHRVELRVRRLCRTQKEQQQERYGAQASHQNTKIRFFCYLYTFG